jgi:putative hydrolase of HD superfamily
MDAERLAALIEFLALADRLKHVERRGRFARLPPDLGARLRALWEEFEEGESDAARFAMACDRAQGFLQGVIGTGHWRQQGVSDAQTRGRMDPARRVAPVFEALIEALYERARQGRMFAEPRA